jgi:catechol 2,3-dioxygenase-like lactoylglutathione lyase family enzyme
MAEEHPVPDGELPRWRGVNHLALITPDMDATVRFYHGVLGARLVACLGNEFFRHYFFELGPENTVAFFEYRTLQITPFAKPAGVPDPRAVQFDHVSFNLADEQALLNLRARLKAAGSEVTDVVDHSFIRSIYFTDPSGIALEGHRCHRTRRGLRRPGPVRRRRPGASGARAASYRPSGIGSGHPAELRLGRPVYWRCRPEMARAITRCWISLVPSKMVKIFASRCIRSTG